MEMLKKSQAGEAVKMSADDDDDDDDNQKEGMSGEGKNLFCLFGLAVSFSEDSESFSLTVKCSCDYFD